MKGVVDVFVVFGFIDVFKVFYVDNVNVDLFVVF